MTIDPFLALDSLDPFIGAIAGALHKSARFTCALDAWEAVRDELKRQRIPLMPGDKFSPFNDADGLLFSVPAEYAERTKRIVERLGG